MFSFLLYATFVSSYSTFRKPTSVLRATPSRRCGPMPIVLRVYLRSSSCRVVVVYRPKNSSLRFVFVVRLSLDRCLLVLCFQRHPIHVSLVAEPWGLSLESLQVRAGRRPHLLLLRCASPNRLQRCWAFCKDSRDRPQGSATSDRCIG